MDWNSAAQKHFFNVKKIPQKSRCTVENNPKYSM
jgi:hypothetical protein